MEGSEEFLPFKSNHSKCGFGEVHRGEHDLASVSHQRDTFDEDASKQSSSPTLDRPTRILDRGRSDVDGTVASNNVGMSQC